MCKKHAFLVLVISVVLAGPLWAGHIVWVDEGAADGFTGWQALLEGAGHTTTLLSDMRTVEADELATMNEADLVIVSRDTDSGNYANDAAEIALWNGVETPLIQCSAYIIRSNRWQWVNSTGTPAIGASDNLVIVQDHPIFKGVGTVGDEIAMVTGTANISDSSDPGNGLSLGTHTDGRLWITYWDAETQFYNGTAEVGTAPRLWFGAGFGIDDATKGGLNLTPEGEQIFLNAVSFMLGEAEGVATEPSPVAEATDVPRDVVLSWLPYELAATHDVYLGTVYDDVNDASRDNPLGVLVSQDQTDVTYAPDALLDFGQTYYWRVDEVNGAPDYTVFKGEVWSFTAEPFAYAVEGVIATTNMISTAGQEPENAVNGSGLDENDQHSMTTTDMWTAKPDPDANDVPYIQFEFDRVYKMHEMVVWNHNMSFEFLLGVGLKDVTIEYSTDSLDWTLLGDVELAQAPGDPTYAGSPVALDGIPAKFIRLTIDSNYGGTEQFGLSEVRFMYLPAFAREPEPVGGAADVDVNPVLDWRGGRGAASHDVLLGTDPNEMELVATTVDSSYAPADLEYGVTYYWQIVEINEAEPVTAWDSDLWTFTTEPYKVVDDFESYIDDVDAGDVVWEIWIDGLVAFGGDAANGRGVVGNDVSPFCEQTIVHGGGQSMPFRFSGAISEADRSFSPAQDWTANGLKSLSLWFYGAEGNTGDLYVKINGTKVAYPGNPANIAKAVWQPFNVDLTTIGGAGSVTELSIGVDNAGADQALLLIDDIRLYPSLPELVYPVEPDSEGLLAQYEFEGNTNDSSGNGLNGSATDAVTVAGGQSGMALEVTDGGYVDLGNPSILDFATEDWAVAAWYKTSMSGVSDANKGCIVGKGGDTGGGHRWCLIMSEDGDANEGHVSLVTDNDVTKYVLTSPSVTNDDEWHLVVGQRVGGTTLELYTDGVLETTAGPAADYDLSGTVQHNAYIGTITNHGDGSLYKTYEGLVDDVRVYHRALSAGEVLGLSGETMPMPKAF